MCSLLFVLSHPHIEVVRLSSWPECHRRGTWPAACPSIILVKISECLAAAESQELDSITLVSALVTRSPGQNNSGEMIG